MTQLYEPFLFYYYKDSKQVLAPKANHEVEQLFKGEAVDHRVHFGT